MHIYSYGSRLDILLCMVEIVGGSFMTNNFALTVGYGQSVNLFIYKALQPECLMSWIRLRKQTVTKTGMRDV